jgi:hypothetical protein
MGRLLFGTALVGAATAAASAMGLLSGLPLWAPVVIATMAFVLLAIVTA